MPADRRRDRRRDRHAEQRRAYQLGDSAWGKFGAKAKAVGSNRAAITAQLVLWWIGCRAEPPARPD